MEIVSNVLTKQPLVKPRYTVGRFGPVMPRNLDVLFQFMHQLRSEVLFLLVANVGNWSISVCARVDLCHDVMVCKADPEVTNRYR